MCLKTWKESGRLAGKKRAYTRYPIFLTGKYYCLEMFPYPSGKLHMGHVRNYSIGDVVARFKTMQGFHVLHPMGWDAFGLPAENAAIKHGGIHPAEWTIDNIDNMRAQLKQMGISYDWNREVATCHRVTIIGPSGFSPALAQGLAYKKKAAVNWCPECATVLANEQVKDGGCERCKTPVEKRELAQWFFKITAYAERLLKDMELLEGWPKKVRSCRRTGSDAAKAPRLTSRWMEWMIQLPFTPPGLILYSASPIWSCPRAPAGGEINRR